MKNIYIALYLVATVLAATAQTNWKAMLHILKFSSASAIWLYRSDGRFKDFDATLVQTNDDLSDSKLNATIKVNSINTDNEKRDGILSQPTSSTLKNSEIMFASKSFKKSGKDTYKIAGDLTMHGITKPVVLDTS